MGSNLFDQQLFTQVFKDTAGDDGLSFQEFPATQDGYLAFHDATQVTYSNGSGCMVSLCTQHTAHSCPPATAARLSAAEPAARWAPDTGSRSIPRQCGQVRRPIAAGVVLFIKLLMPPFRRRTQQALCGMQQHVLCVICAAAAGHVSMEVPLAHLHQQLHALYAARSCALTTALLTHPRPLRRRSLHPSGRAGKHTYCSAACCEACL